MLVFLVSAQIQQGKVSDANHLLGGAGYPATSANNILVLGSDVRTSANAEPGAQTSGNGRSDSILLMRIGGGANSRLSIARDTIVDIPGAGRQKINAAYSIGGTALAVQTIEAYTGVDINHVMIVSFEDFPQLIDAMGGITYKGGCVVSRINGGYARGGYTLRLKAGKTHIDGKQALALARTRTNDCAKNENDLTRARRQQKIVSAMKRRLLSPMAFVRLPLISWNVPKALRSDMSGPTLLGFFGALAVAGSAHTRAARDGLGPDLRGGQAGEGAALPRGLSAQLSAGLEPEECCSTSSMNSTSPTNPTTRSPTTTTSSRSSPSRTSTRPWRTSHPTSRSSRPSSWSCRGRPSPARASSFRSRCCRSPCP